MLHGMVGRGNGDDRAKVRKYWSRDAGIYTGLGAFAFAFASAFA